MYWSESFEGELPAVKQSSCIDKTSPCFVLVSYYMLKSWAVKGYLTLWFHWWPDRSYGWLRKPSRHVVKGKFSFRTRGSVLQLPRIMFRHKEFVSFKAVYSQPWIMKMKRLFVKFSKKREWFWFVLDTAQHQPSQPCIQEADHRAWVDGDNWRMSLEQRGGVDIVGLENTVQEKCGENNL